eukprot:3937609-Rhodomonas_salina.1
MQRHSRAHSHASRAGLSPGWCSPWLPTLPHPLSTLPSRPSPGGMHADERRELSAHMLTVHQALAATV